MFASIRSAFRRLQALFTRRRLDEEFDHEVESHLALLTEENIRRGMTPEEARYAALRSFGGVTQVKESNRTHRSLPHLETLLQDLRYAARMMRKTPGFSAMAVATLALGISLNTSIFSTVSGVLLNRPPVSDPDRLMVVAATNPAHGLDQALLSAPDFNDWREQNHSFEDMAAADAYTVATLTGDGPPQQFQAMRVSANFFSVLGVSPFLGRGFLPAEDTQGQDHVVVLSYGLWQERYAADPLVIGKTVTIGGQTYRVIGVMPARFRLVIFPAQMWMPLVLDSEKRMSGSRASRHLHVFARLKDGISLTAAQSDVTALAERSAAEYPDTNRGWTATAESLQEYMIRDLNVRPSILVMMCAVGFILVLACANLSSLLLTKVTARGHEMSVRAALGASRWRLTRQLLVESLMMSLAGGLFGLLLSVGGLRIFRLMLSSMGPVGTAMAEQLRMDLSVMAFTLLLSVATTILFGLAPAIAGARANVQSALKNDARAGGLSHQRLRSALVSTEITLALVLVMGAAFLISAIVQSFRRDLGFDPSAIVTAEVSLSEAKYADTSSRSAFFLQLIQNIKAAPGVSSVGAASNLVATGARRFPFRIQGNSEQPAAERPLARYYLITHDYLQTMGISLLRGRYFSDADNEKGSGVALINECLSRQFFANQEALGKFIKLDTGSSGQSEWREIVGVVGNVKNWAGQMSDEPQVYELYAQHPVESMVLAVRGSSETVATTKVIRDAISALDKDQPVGRIAAMNAVLSEERAGGEFTIEVFGVFATLSLVLAAIGVYGVTSYSVVQRTQEIGIRVALGAQRRDVIQLVVGASIRLIAVGGAIGLLLAWPLPRMFSAMFQDFRGNTLWIYSTVPLLIGSLAGIACYLPARRAARIEPMTALRHQ